MTKHPQKIIYMSRADRALLAQAQELWPRTAVSRLLWGALRAAVWKENAMRARAMKAWDSMDVL